MNRFHSLRSYWLKAAPKDKAAGLTYQDSSLKFQLCDLDFLHHEDTHLFFLALLYFQK